MSRADRLINKKRDQLAKTKESSTLVREQIEEEQEVTDNIVRYAKRVQTPLDYVHEGVKHTVPAYTEDGKEMSYHDQYYQITRMKNGLPIEAKRMIDYKFDLDAARHEDADDRSLVDPTFQSSEEYLRMKEQHEAQHPPIEEDTDDD